jgi:ABC-2 type transport system permease protein
MPIDIARYHVWQGPHGSTWRGVAAMVRVALIQVFRRKSYWVVLLLGLIHFLIVWALIYVLSLKELPTEVRENILEFAGFSAKAKRGEQFGYIRFIEVQGVVVMILLAFSGSLLVGSDFNNSSVSFYLSRGIDRRHYLIGKLLSIGILIQLITTVPAFLLFVEYGALTASLQYWISNWRAPIAILFHGLVLASFMSVLLVTTSAYLKRMAPIAITWSSLFVMLPALARLMDRNSYWRLIDPWRDIHFVGRIAFDQFSDDPERHFAYWAAGLLTTVCAIALVALFRRVRAVEVVE